MSTSTDDTECPEDTVRLAGGGPEPCVECGHVNDDNSGEAMCRTCADWIVTQ